jgi:hypothetical protein
LSWWAHIHEPPVRYTKEGIEVSMANQIERLREIAVELGKTNLAGLSSWMRSQGLDYYDVLKEFSP